MKYIHLSNGKQMSKIGLGVSRFGTRIPAELAEEQLEYFVQKGGTLIDTARNYYEWVDNGRGKSEEFLGNWLQKSKCRDEIVLSTKGGVRNDGKKFYINLSHDPLIAELHESLDALQTEYLDIYLLHRDEPERPVEEIMDTLQEIQEIGKCECIGVCNWQPKRIKQANEYAHRNGLIPITVIQTWWSMAAFKKEMWDDPSTTYMDEETYTYCKENHCIAMGYTSQAKGFFQKAFSCSLEEIDPMLRYRIVNEENLRKLEELRRFCKETHSSPTDVVLGYITSNPLKGIALVSCSKLDQLREVLSSADYDLSTGEINRIDLCGGKGQH